MNGNYLSKRLSDTGIACDGFNTFESHYYCIRLVEYYKLTNKEIEELKKTPFDNILFRYSTIFGKYHRAKGDKIFPFFNGIYTYFIKPLLANGHTKVQIIEELKSTFRKKVLTEGEFKALVGCQYQIPTIGSLGFT